MPQMTRPDATEALPISEHGHCASDCCDWYPRLHVHGDRAEYDRWLALAATPAPAAEPPPDAAWTDAMDGGTVYVPSEAAEPQEGEPGTEAGREVMRHPELIEAAEPTASPGDSDG